MGSTVQGSQVQPNSTPEVDGLFTKLAWALQRNWPALTGAVSSIASGAWLMIDDYRDIDITKLVRRPHHFLWGTLLLLAGTAGLGFSLLNILLELYD